LTRWGRFAPFTGMVFVVLIVVSIAVSANTPDSDASGVRVISFYTTHRSSVQASDILFGLAAVFFAFFAGSLYGFVRRPPAAQTLAAVGLGGALVFAVGMAIFAGLGFALADVPGKLSPGAAQALNVLENDLFMPFAVGSIVFGVAMGLAIVRGRELAPWLGWALLALGILSVAVFPLYLVLLVWIVVVSILLYRRTGELRADGTPTANESDLIGSRG
jgi:hypothetical protein